MSEDHFLSRWSRRKIEARTAAPPPEPAPPATPVAPASEAAMPAAAGASQASARGAEPLPLPPVETLTFDSDFAAFMQPGVDSLLRRQALKTLMNDPRFNVMDRLDVYIDDYSIPDPMPEGWIEKLNQYASLGNHEPGATPCAVEPPDDGERSEDVALAEGDSAEPDSPPEVLAETQEPDTSDEGSSRPEQGQSTQS